MSLAIKAERKILKESKLEGLVTPSYNGMGISDIGPTILKGFGVKTNRGLDPGFFDYSLFKGVKNVVMLCVDGLGQNLMRNRMKDLEGFPITSVFPSTTPVALSTISLGITPQEHGILGFWVYFRELGDVVSMLRFGPAHDVGSYIDVGIDPEIFFPKETSYTALAKKGVKSTIFHKFVNNGFSSIYNGAEQLPYKSIGSMFANANKALKKSGKKFLYLYMDDIDTASHLTGTKSNDVKKVLSNIENEVERFISKAPKDTLFLMTADHGQINLPFSKEKSFLDHPDLLGMLSSSPSGESRASYIFAKNGKKEKVREYLEEHFSKNAYVFESGDLLKRNFFGVGKPSPETKHRLGDFVLISKGDYRFSFPYLEGRGMIGFHGGLSKDEMLVPFMWRRT